MRENRPYGSEGGGTELNRSLLPLSCLARTSKGPVAWSSCSVGTRVGRATNEKGHVAGATCYELTPLRRADHAKMFAEKRFQVASFQVLGRAEANPQIVSIAVRPIEIAIET
jgi:hypothetical protein